MAKRKGANAKTKTSKKAKVDNTVVDDNKNEASEKSTSKDELENFKRKLGMVKSEIDSKDWFSESDCLVYSPDNCKSSEKVATFDLDDTLIVAKSGKKFAQSWSDWKFLFDDIPDKFKSLHNDGYKIVIFSNQGGVEKGKVKEVDLKKKINSIVEKLDLPIQVFMSIAYASQCRKPNCGMFYLLRDKYNSGITINLEESFYVGDAAGRPENWAPKKKKDFSCSDRLFAHNCKLKFYTPEEYFLQEKEAPYKLPEFNPVETIENCQKTVFSYDNFTKTTNDIHEILPKDSETVLVLMVGSPSSGKSTFCKKYLEPLGFSVINRDTLKTWQKCVAETKRLLNEKKCVVIDNTNPDAPTRERYVSVAAECGTKHIVCFIMDTPSGHCKHNEIFRQLTVESHEKISEMVFNMHKSKYQEPNDQEKFTMICKVVPGLEFENEDHKNLYSRYLVDK